MSLAEIFLFVILKYGVVASFLMIIGFCALITAIISEGSKVFKYGIAFGVALPIILIKYFVDKKNHVRRREEIGEIRAHLKKHPGGWAGIVVAGIFLVMLVGLIISTVVIQNSASAFLKADKMIAEKLADGTINRTDLLMKTQIYEEVTKGDNNG